MEAYTDFAAVYDTFMDETPYEVWGTFVAGLIEKYGISKPVRSGTGQGKELTEEYDTAEDSEQALNEEKNLIVELGCGTGSFTQELYKLGYDIMGIDMSPEMLNLARQKSADAGLDIMYLEQDMRELDLYCTAGTIVSVCDSVNYVLEDEEIIETFRLVNNFLYPGGVFIFDFNTLFKYRDVIGDTTIAENRDDCSFIWDNYFDEDTCINELSLSLFIPEDSDNELYRRHNELHLQRAYTLDTIKSLIERSGMRFITAYHAFTEDAPDDESDRIYVIAQECGK